MKIYRGRRMVDLFSLYMCSPSYNTIRRENRKDIHFVLGEHQEIFKCVTEIYVKVKIAHIISSAILMILLEDETKVKARATWEPKYDTLARFCRSKVDHVCNTKFKSVVGVGEEGYNTIVDCFRNNKLERYAQVVIVNPLRDKLPRLVLVVCATYNCFDSKWVRGQWHVIDKLWAEECL
jgi:hypothetical protein